MSAIIEKHIPEEMWKAAIKQVVTTSGSLPVVIKLARSQISIDEMDLIATMEILNHSPEKELPQMCSHSSQENTPYGLDRELKIYTNRDLSRANYVSDILFKAGIVKLKKVINPMSGKEVNGTKLRQEWCW